ncbi:MAG: class I SAM-dependent methyltransferase [Ignavibacteriota bacterium]|nr:class I SAM-dependent methyltransferase [Ignavibacterium sp.]MCO6448563.1 class I SAM-dependent methyltransferase [Ignavibacterium album]MCZ2269911.1 class I SAM-dependent methyltransferase [Ignavibacteriales bacterium]QKJ98322.1 MAG: class I SAM-dependent methyltransferase [Ignavibacteriota bacterium]HMN18815.1 methyltransferase domain-containing protein [Ignavibacteriaceae bacterium]
MHYDPVKNIFANVIKKSPLLRVFFYKILDLMFLRSWYVRRELKNLRKLFGSKKISIYDAGSGYGQYSYFMSKALQPCEIYSVDVKEDWINDCIDFFKSQKIENVSFGIEDLTVINHTDKFDLIVCVDVMEHIEDDRKVFENFYTALKKNGYLIINTPSIYGGSDVHDDDDESFIGEHARDGYSKEELEAKLHPAGFATYQSKYTYGFWGDKAWRLGIKYPILMVNLSKLFLIILPLYYLLTFPFTFIMMWIDYKSNNKVGSGINFIAAK